MVMLVSLEQASEHLRRDSTDDDASLELTIQAASQAIINYITDTTFLNSYDEVEYDSSGEPLGVPKPIQQATLILIGMLYTDRDGVDFREGKNAPRLGDIILPRAVHFLLDAYRMPVVC